MIKIETAYKYKATVTKVVDGDTIDAIVDLGYRISANIRFRVKDFNAPEIYRPKDADELASGKTSKALAESLLLNQDVMIQSFKEGPYNRWEAIITLEDGRDFVDVMVENGCGVKEIYG